ncbi:MAG: hypothetical protein JW940_04545 [Polyangiaceae bacterium]|nr:hypothetical protein [Polyangiaceae bacterium]
MDDAGSKDVVTVGAGRPAPGRGCLVKLGLTMREFDLPPIGDGVLIGRRAAIGPRGLYEAIDRMLPGAYELVAVEGHAVVEAVIVRSAKLRIVQKKTLVDLFLRHAEALMTESTIIRVDLECEVTVRMELET